MLAARSAAAAAITRRGAGQRPSPTTLLGTSTQNGGMHLTQPGATGCGLTMDRYVVGSTCTACRDLLPTALAEPQPARHGPRCGPSAAWPPEASRPSKGEQVLAAGFLGRKPALQGHNRQRVVLQHDPRHYPSCLVESSAYPQRKMTSTKTSTRWHPARGMNQRKAYITSDNYFNQIVKIRNPICVLLPIRTLSVHFPSSHFANAQIPE
jgi:hypothetical protein